MRFGLTLGLLIFIQGCRAPDTASQSPVERAASRDRVLVGWYEVNGRKHHAATQIEQLINAETHAFKEQHTLYWASWHGRIASSQSGKTVFMLGPNTVVRQKGGTNESFKRTSPHRLVIFRLEPDGIWKRQEFMVEQEPDIHLCRDNLIVSRPGNGRRKVWSINRDSLMPIDDWVNIDKIHFDRDGNRWVGLRGGHVVWGCFDGTTLYKYSRMPDEPAFWSPADFGCHWYGDVAVLSDGVCISMTDGVLGSLPDGARPVAAHEDLGVIIKLDGKHKLIHITQDPFAADEIPHAWNLSNSDRVKSASPSGQLAVVRAESFIELVPGGVGPDRVRYLSPAGRPYKRALDAGGGFIGWLSVE